MHPPQASHRHCEQDASSAYAEGYGGRRKYVRSSCTSGVQGIEAKRNEESEAGGNRSEERSPCPERDNDEMKGEGEQKEDVDGGRGREGERRKDSEDQEAELDE